ncbi:phosphatidylglycerol lysyltransferase domain-containing protein [Streptomyces sp. NBC_00378]|uniref:phosphatidylglycerol lysyltransferase domain-containing protein n=1 Tax=unclassified Streptomyces TaxID=2593676 RepID=UPI00225941DE|nr:MULTISPECIES: phosphatidylglycerol lysyltransferase domain-containing protein [unclassified Streptomyces]MCX5107764.1 phosphatidylglycerol lysyltransferase domain-containing protein [Streptomyces sp. NBC_00378]
MGRVRRSPQPGANHSEWPRRGYLSAVWYLRAVAFINFLGAVWVSLGNDIRRHSDDEFFTPYLLTAGFFSGVLSAFLAITMRRRKRAAWILNLALAGLTLVLTALALELPVYRQHVQNWIAVLLTAFFVAAMLAGRREFHAKGDRANPKLAAVVGVVGLAVGSLLATTMVTVSNTAPNAGRSDFLERWHYGVLRMFSLAYDDIRFEGISTPGWANVLINLMSTALILLVLYAAFRSRRAVDPQTDEDQRGMRALLERHGDRDSLGYFALRRDKSVIWSPSGKSAVAYRVVGGVSLASGDPIGDPEAWPGAIDRWLVQAGEHGWTPSVIGASEEGGIIYARHGLNALELGDEAIVDIGEFTTEGRAIRGVRQAHHRVERAGYTVRVSRHEDMSADEMTEMIELADDWRDGATERGFSMALGRLGDPQDGRCIMLVCRDAAGRPRALLSFVPWGADGLSLDLMRRDRNSDNGLFEFMVLELIRRAGDLGITQVSLNFAMFRAVFERGSRIGAGPVLRLWRSLLTFFSRWWQIESLYRANAKYRPIWEPRFLLYAQSTDLPRIALASARAEGFLEAPGLPKWLHRRRLETRR